MSNRIQNVNNNMKLTTKNIKAFSLIELMFLLGTITSLAIGFFIYIGWHFLQKVW